MQEADLDALDAREVLAWAVEHHHPRLAAACSFQKEASVILDLLLGIEPQARFFTLYETHHDEGETFRDFAARTDPEWWTHELAPVEEPV